MSYNYQDKAGLTYMLSKLKNWLDSNTVKSVSLDGVQGTKDANKNLDLTLPIASDETLGGIKVGENLTIDNDGTLNAQDSYDLPIASDTTLGGIKVGDMLAIDSTTGVLDVDIDFNTPLSAQNKAATMSDVNSAVSSALEYKGSVTFANIPTADLNTGDMYNITDAFVTDNRFKEGSGKSYPAGTNIARTNDGYWDVLAGFIDTSHFVLDSDMVPITTAEIDVMFANW